MANAKGHTIDKTHLSVDQAESRGFIHRDYIAHCLRWTKIAKDLGMSGRFNDTDLIDVGCGKDMPLARTLMTSRMAPRRYLGIEYNKMEVPAMFANTKFKPELITETDFTTIDMPSGEFNTSVCLEVLEHVEPTKAITILNKISDVVKPGGTCYFSTPCYDEKVGAAKNHVNEMTYEGFGSLLEACGYEITGHWGTFASMKDYKNEMNEHVKYVFDSLREYYETNYLSTIFAPLYPHLSRNTIWKCSNKSLNPLNTIFTPIKQQEGRLGSSESWEDMKLAG
tara:strand:+ start:35 stop:877 length:843 start_codon:yes stop_codon:yes gene_type:complete